MYLGCITEVIKEFGEDHGVIYVDKPEEVLKKVVELIENGCVDEEGRKARGFVEKYNWEDIVVDFGKGCSRWITFKVENHIIRKKE